MKLLWPAILDLLVSCKMAKHFLLRALLLFEERVKTGRMMPKYDNFSAYKSYIIIIAYK